MPRPRTTLAGVLLAMLMAVPAAYAAGEESPVPAFGTPETVYSPDGVIVQWAPSTERGDRIDAREEAEVTSESDLGRSFQLVTVEPGQTPAEAIAALEADPTVVLAERDGYVAMDAIPNDPLFNQLWGLRNLGLGVGGVSDAIEGVDVNAVSAWDRSVGSPSVVIADLDSGYRFEHPDLGPVAWTNPDEVAGNGIDDDANTFVDDTRGWDFVGANGEAIAPDNNPNDDDLLSGGHGVHTAGTLGAAGNNGIGISGVSRNIRIMPLRICTRFPALEDGRCPISAEVAGINYAGKEGARVANMSLGGTGKETVVANALAANPGTLYVISAGNDGENNDTEQHHYPCDFNPTVDASPAVPGAIDNVLCVAATDQADRLAGFSNYGATSVDLGAPGTETLSTYPFFQAFEEHFSVDDFATKWPATGAGGGFQRTSESPLTSFGMTDVIGAPTINTVRETTSKAIVIPANGGCRLTQTRRVVLAAGDQYRYSVLLNGVELTSSSPASTSVAGLDTRFLDLPAAFKAGGEVQLRFRFTAGAVATANSGVWLDDVTIRCAEAVGAATGYGFLQGTSMATPHVTGAAGLLFSLKPTATVTAVRNALMLGADRIPALTGKTVSGGRLDVPHAMDALEGLAVDNLPPAAPLLTSTVPAAPAANATPRIVGSSEAGSTLRIHAGGACKGAATATGTASGLASPGIAVNVPNSATLQFSARAIDLAGNISSCSAPISYTNNTPLQNAVLIPPGNTNGGGNGGSGGSSAASCKVPALAGMTLAKAKTALVTAHCTLGKTTKPKAKKGKRLPPLVVKSSTPAAGTSPANGTVDLKLGPKPKPKKKRH